MRQLTHHSHYQQHHRVNYKIVRIIHQDQIRQDGGSLGVRDENYSGCEFSYIKTFVCLQRISLGAGWVNFHLVVGLLFSVFGRNRKSLVVG